MSPAPRSPNPSLRGAFLTAAGTAEYLAVPAATLTDWRYKRTGPAFYRIGQQVRYNTDDLAAWLDAHRVTTT